MQGSMQPSRYYKKTMIYNPWDGLAPKRLNLIQEGPYQSGDPSRSLPTQVDRTRSIREQVEYYFTPANVEKDHYLQSQMMSRGSKGEGWVDLVTINSFARIQRYQISSSELAKILSDSSKLDVQSDEDNEILSGGWWVRSRPIG